MNNDDFELKEKLGRLFFIGLPSADLDDETKHVLETISPGAIILFSRNICSPEQVRRYVTDINTFLGYEPVFCIDQEGGIVSRLRKGFAVAPGAMAVAATGKIENARSVARVLGGEMRTLGINWNLAPVVDINSFPKNPGIGVRSYGDRAEQVIAYAGKFIQGLRETGICSCIKHFPGLGRVSVDPHLGRPEVRFSKKELLAQELQPYIKLRADSIMPSHAFYSALQTVNEPASLSREVLTDFARNELGFKGLFVADALTMGGVTESFTPLNAALAALAAGMDFLSFCHNSEEQKEVFKGSLKAVFASSVLQQRLEESFKRVDSFIHYAQKGILREKGVQAPKPLVSVGSEPHVSLMQKITAEGITLRSSRNNPAKPINHLENVSALYSVILTRPVEAEEGPEENEAPYAARLLAKILNLPLYTFKADLDFAHPQTEDLLKKIPQTGRTLIFTEDALVHAGQEALVKAICKKAKDHLLIALRNPYDAFLPEVTDALMIYGYERISQLALLDVLEGKKAGSGVFPLKIQ